MVVAGVCFDGEHELGTECCAQELGVDRYLGDAADSLRGGGVDYVGGFPAVGIAEGDAPLGDVGL